MSKKGKLYLIPVPIAEDSWHTIPVYVLEQMHQLHYFIVERARTSRRMLRASGFKGAIDVLHFYELDKREGNLPEKHFFDPLMKGKDMGLLSEAGMPAIADPGSQVVAMAHDLGIEVVPLIGPSSLFLSLAASGLNGQHFAFRGYLPVKKPQLLKSLVQLEKNVLQQGETQIFIETPYRNNSIVESIIAHVNPKLKLSIAMELTGELEFIKTKRIKDWKTGKMPEMHKKTAIFLLGK